MAEIVLSEYEQRDIERIARLPFGWERLKNSTVLISGGSGFIGKRLIATLVARNRLFGDDISVVSISRHAHEDGEFVKYIAADISKPLSFDGGADYVIHLASNTHPAQYAAEPVGTITTNVFGCDNLLKLCVEKKVKRFLLASSVEVYGNGDGRAMDEEYCGYINCNTVRAGYNEAKRVSESLCQAYGAQYGMDFAVCRLARVFGADEKKDTKALAQFMERAACGQDIILKSKGGQRFSYCYVWDAVSGILKVLLDGACGEAYNVSADDDGRTLGDYAAYIAQSAGKKVIIDESEAQKGASVAASALVDCAKLKALGWQPHYSVLQGLDMTMRIKMEKRTVI